MIKNTWFVVAHAGSFDARRIREGGSGSYWFPKVVAGPFKKSEAESVASQKRAALFAAANKAGHE